MGRNRPSNEDAPRVPGEEGGRPWGKIVLGLLLLLALALLIPFACQALQDSGNGGSGDPRSSGGEQTADDGSGDEGNSEAGNAGGAGGAAGGTTAQDGRGSAGAETTAQDAAGGDAGDDNAGDGGERAGGTAASIADIGRAGSGDGRVVTVPRAEIPGTEGWISVRADDGGRPGRVLGVAPLSAGENTNVEVELDRPLDSSQRLYAMLHREDPSDGEYTFPDGDPPVEENGEAVAEPFDYSLASAGAEAGADAGGGADGAGAEGATVNGEGVEDGPLPDSSGGSFAAVAGGLALLAAGGLLRLRVNRTSRRATRK